MVIVVYLCEYAKNRWTINFIKVLKMKTDITFSIFGFDNVPVHVHFSRLYKGIFKDITFYVHLLFHGNLYKMRQFVLFPTTFEEFCFYFK